MDLDERRRAMLTGPLVPTILSLAAPNVVNVSVQSLVLIADGWFVGRLGTAELAALSCSPYRPLDGHGTSEP
jgi:Na+-driven multidrug efflux pump